MKKNKSETSSGDHGQSRINACGAINPVDQTSHASSITNSATTSPQPGGSNLVSKLLLLIGTLLSPGVPLDPVLNVPIAYGMGWLAAKIYPPALMPVYAVVLVGTNLLGALMMRIWGPAALGQKSAPYTPLKLVKDLALAAGYMVGISVLTKLGVFSTALTLVKHLVAVIGITPAV